MANLVSPGIQVREIDLTNVIPAVSASIGAIAGAFRWGPVEQVITVGSEKQLVSIFGAPDFQTAPYFFSAAQFLQYGNTLKVVRAATGSTNADSADTAGTILIKNADNFESQALGIANRGAAFFAKYPGELGNSLRVDVCGAVDSTTFAVWPLSDLFDAAPGTSAHARRIIGGTEDINDELHVAVVDEDGAITGVPGEVLERFSFLSQASNAVDENNANNYYVDVINAQSAYIWAATGDGHLTDLTDSGDTFETVAGQTDKHYATGTAHIVSSLNGGSDDNEPTNAEILTAYQLFRDVDTEEVNLIVGGPTPVVDGATHCQNMIALAEERKDCIAFLSPHLSATVNAATPADEVVTWANGLTSSSYAVFDSSALYIYDRYNDVYRYIPANGAIAGLCANADRVADPWYSPAGFARGQLLGITRLAFNPIQADRDALFKARVNPLVSFPGQGTVLFGDKTALSKPSVFGQIGVRRLFNILKRAISIASRSRLFEFNDQFSRAQFRNLVEPYLRDVRGRRGVSDFLVVCDETNNTPEVIQQERFVADIYIKPSIAARYIDLNFIATRQGVEFSEIVGRI